MKKIFIITILLGLNSLSKAQPAWNGANTSVQADRTGPVGIGTSTIVNKLTVLTSSGGDGIRIQQSGTGATGMHFDPSAGHLWSIYCTGTADGWGANHFAIQDQTGSASPRMFIDGNTGYMGVGTISPGARVHASASGTGTNAFIAMEGVCTGSTGTQVLGGFFDAYGPGSTTYAVDAHAHGSGDNNWGGYFVADGADGFNIGISATGDAYAGIFFGDVSRTGTDNFTSDRKLKNDIKPMTNALDKIRLLKPSTYTFKREEFKELNLPKGNQMGLIAQELEQVFPDLVSEMKGYTHKSPDGRETVIPSFKTVQYISLITVLISAVQEQQNQIDELKKQNGITGLDQSKSGVQTNNFTMEQNIPNPFTHETVINYNLPQEVNSAYMAVYDLSGKQQAKFPIQEKGKSSVTISSEKLSPGIYLYSIIADGQVLDTKKMIIAGN